MSEPINPRVVDLSHWNPANDYGAVKDAGIVGVIYKATEGTSFTDNTYVQQQHAAKAAGLKWGAILPMAGTWTGRWRISCALPRPTRMNCSALIRRTTGATP